MTMWIPCYKKAQQCLFLLRNLKNFDVPRHFLEMAYIGLVESILSFNIVTWYGNITVKNKATLTPIVRGQQSHWLWSEAAVQPV